MSWRGGMHYKIRLNTEVSGVQLSKFCAYVRAAPTPLETEIMGIGSFLSPTTPASNPLVQVGHM